MTEQVPGTDGAASRGPAGDLAGTADAAAAEAAKTRETANRMAEREPSEDIGKEVRQLAGMVQQLAEQVERLAVAVRGR